VTLVVVELSTRIRGPLTFGHWSSEGKGCRGGGEERRVSKMADTILQVTSLVYEDK
jgi:hypothetical protein